MNHYHYATIDKETFPGASKLPLPGPGAYLAKDEQAEPDDAPPAGLPGNFPDPD